jgi:hypothetical protein
LAAVVLNAVVDSGDNVLSELVFWGAGMSVISPVSPEFISADTLCLPHLTHQDLNLFLEENKICQNYQAVWQHWFQATRPPGILGFPTKPYYPSLLYFF